MNGLLALAFGAGMLAPVNPCGFAVLPAFLAYAVDNGGDGAARRGVPARLASGLRAGAALTLGFAGTFTAIGLALALGMRSLIGVVPWLAAAVGAILTLLGLAMLAGWRPSIRLPTRRSRTPGQGPRGMIAFGAGYAVAAASCTLAVLLAVITQALASTNLTGVLLVFGAYAAGSATLLLTLALFAAFASGLIHRFLRRLLPHLHRITGAVLALSGGYLLFYWLPQLLGDGRPGGAALTGVVAAIATWISAHQTLIALTALGVVTAAAVAVLLAHTVRTRSDHTVKPTEPSTSTPTKRKRMITGRAREPQMASDGPDGQPSGATSLDPHPGVRVYGRRRQHEPSQWPRRTRS